MNQKSTSAKCFVLFISAITISKQIFLLGVFCAGKYICSI